MPRTLVCVESPHKAKVIGDILGKDFVVLPTVGHFKEMPLKKSMTKEEKEKYGDFAIDVSHDFEPLYRVAPGKAKVLKAFRDAIKTVDDIVIATDPDSEGAAIGYLLIDELKPKKPTYRATWNEITEKAVREGLRNKKLISMEKREPKEFFDTANSALARASWDRLFGFSVTPFVWKAMGMANLSAGRVQSPGARLVVEREIQRLEFVSVEFYTITGVFTFDGEDIEAQLISYKGQSIANSSHIDENGNVKDGFLLITGDNIDDIVKDVEKNLDYVVSDVSSKPYRRTPPPPFTTSSALQSIGAKTGWSSKQLTSIFQDLYQSGHISYIRTVSVMAAPEAVEAARRGIVSQFGKTFVSPVERVYKDKKTGNSGHECIRPTLDEKGNLVSPNVTDSKQAIVFDLIKKRMMASQSIDCTGTSYTVTVSNGDAVFSSSETEIENPGWTTIYAEDKN